VSSPFPHAIVITGASTGIGQACALHLDRRGWLVFAGVRRQIDADRLTEQASARLTPLFIDLTDQATIRRATETVAASVGQSGLGALINNAGIARGGPLEFLGLAELRQQFEVNVIGQVAVTQAFLPLLRQGQGRVINISSISGRVAMPFQGPYSASKFALEALTDALRRELRPWEIEVVSIQPGAISTPIWEKAAGWGQTMLQKLPPEGQRLYGPALEKLLASLEARQQNGISPEVVAREVVRALTARRPKTRYLVGSDAWLGAWLVYLLPDRWLDRLIAREWGKGVGE
jgi:NAD(P)-dependent dehydrogenase (short-subunit alcohol dehydrogenase family)